MDIYESWWQSHEDSLAMRERFLKSVKQKSDDNSTGSDSDIGGHTDSDSDVIDDGIGGLVEADPAESKMSRKEMRQQRGRKAVMAGWQDDESNWRFPEQNNVLLIEEEGGIVGDRTTVIRPVNSESFARLEDQDEQLLPGLSNEIVLNQIVPKLPRRVLHILSSVSRSWLQAIRSHQVFDARVRSNSTETLFVLNFSHSTQTTEMGVHALCLYSVKEKTWHRLPDFQHIRIARGLPIGCGCVSLDGKVYVLGGKSEDEFDVLGGESEDEFETDSTEVYVLDLAGQTGWRQCADMLEPRQNFAYGVIDGKIYVVGGTSCGKTIRRSEVYDPKENTWSSISPMILTRAGHKFVTVGEELWLYRGSCYDRDCEIFRSDENRAEDDPSFTWTNHSGLRRGRGRKKALFPEVYHPRTGEWKLVKTIERCYEEFLFVAQGKVYSMDPDGIYVDVCDDDKGWRQLYSFSLSGVEESREPLITETLAAYPVDDELFALVIKSNEIEDFYSDSKITLCQSKGFGRENGQIVWEKLNDPFLDEYFSPSFGPPEGEPFMFPVQL